MDNTEKRIVDWLAADPDWRRLCDLPLRRSVLWAILHPCRFGRVMGLADVNQAITSGRIEGN